MPAKKPRAASPQCQVYTFDVCLISGPITEAFAKKNRVVSRTIQIRSDQTLRHLHDAIFGAFDREEEHMYEFQVGGKRPMDPKARRYVLPMAMEDEMLEDRPAGVVHETTIESLGLKVKTAFGYWFDFGDDWWHQLSVEAIGEVEPKAKYPRVTKKVGASPPQYPNEE